MTITINGNGTVTGVSVGGLPDGIVDTDMLDATAVTDGKIANTTISEGKLAAGVNTIQETDIWRVTSSFDSNGTFITSNWERADQAGAEKIGTGMSESSGVFTFPSTGVWNVKFIAQASETSDDIRYAGAYLNTTTNNSSYIEAAIGVGNIHNHNNVCWTMPVAETNFDVTDVSQCKCKFYVGAESSGVTWVGSTTINNTYVVFTRLGDT